jgi:hypothetical protein
MSTPLHAVVARWDAAIADVHTRFEALLQEAWAASEPLVSQMQLDFGPLTRAWGAIEHRLHAHTSEVGDRWEEICDALCEVDGLPEGTTMSEGCKRDLATTELEIRYQQYHRAIMARAAEVMRRHALQADASSLSCTQCGATLSGASPVSQALDVSCAHCRAVNTIEPGASLRMFAAGGALALAEHAALSHWEAMKRAEIRIDQYRDKKAVPMELLESFASSSRAYHATRLEVEAQHVPEQRSYVPSKLERHVKDAEKKLRQFWQWRERVAVSAPTG